MTLLLVFIVLQPANALTIYRIGEASLPAPDIPVSHELTPGDADPLTDGDRLQVDLIGLKSRAIQAMRFSGAVFMPNGDGINDQHELRRREQTAQAQPIALGDFQPRFYFWQSGTVSFSDWRS
ncbi:MAG: hypothetical protein VX792_10235 [Candidatus Latescibacterota bacterium]|nr:hypothetical protein [Candidatus Latescibacterota bacterium]